MSSRYGERGYGRYGDSDDDRTEDRHYERDAERGYGPPGSRPERGSDYGIARRGGYAAGRGGGYERDYDARDPGTRYGREVIDRGGYAGSSRRQEGEDYGRPHGARVYGRAYTRERAYGRGDDPDAVRDYDTDYGRTTSRFYGRSGYEYGRDDYEDERGEPGRRAIRERDDDRGDDSGSWLDRAADQVRSWFGNDDDDRERVDDPRRAYGRGRGEGKFRGRGPKNYRRSDERLREVVCDRLTDNEWLDASDVEVNVVAAEVILTGVVDSRYAKRLAESIAESVSGVSNVQNNLRVQSYQTGMGTQLPAATAMTTPASDMTATNETTIVSPNDPDTGLSSSRAAGRS